MNKRKMKKFLGVKNNIIDLKYEYDTQNDYIISYILYYTIYLLGRNDSSVLTFCKKIKK